MTRGASRRRPGPLPVGLIGLVAAVLAVDVALLWLLVAPRVPILKVEQGFLYADAQPEQAVAADGWFAILGVVAGLLAATAAWFVLRRHRGVSVLVAIVLGSLVGAWLGWRLGVRLERAYFEALAASAPVGTLLDAPLSLRITDLDRDQWWPPKATGVIVAQALAAAFAYTTLAGFASDPDLRVHPPAPEDFRDPGQFDAVRPPVETVQEDQAPTVVSQPPSELSSGPDAPGPSGSPARP
jgi:hypothetical protein